MTIKYTGVKLVMPFGLNWLKRFIRIEFKTGELPPQKIKGQEITSIIVDEADEVIV